MPWPGVPGSASPRGLPGCELAACGAFSATVVRALLRIACFCVGLRAGARLLLEKHTVTKGDLISKGGVEDVVLVYR